LKLNISLLFLTCFFIYSISKHTHGITCTLDDKSKITPHNLTYKLGYLGKILALRASYET